jgi:hypothetical protein
MLRESHKPLTTQPSRLITWQRIRGLPNDARRSITGTRRGRVVELLQQLSSLRLDFDQSTLLAKVGIVGAVVEVDVDGAVAGMPVRRGLIGAEDGSASEAILEIGEKVSNSTSLRSSEG